MGQIRPITICTFSHNGSILVFEGYDPSKDEVFYRPLGGGIEFGEYSRAALIREIREEIEAEITHVRYLGTLENIFINNKNAGHEIVQVYDAEFVDWSLYEQDETIGHEDDGTPFKIVWKSLVDFEDDDCRLYPDGLLELLQQQK